MKTLIKLSLAVALMTSALAVAPAYAACEAVYGNIDIDRPAKQDTFFEVEAAVRGDDRPSYAGPSSLMPNTSGTYYGIAGWVDPATGKQLQIVKLFQSGNSPTVVTANNGSTCTY